MVSLILLSSFQRPAVRSLRRNLLLSATHNRSVTFSTSTFLRGPKKESHACSEQETKSSENKKQKISEDTHMSSKSNVQLITTTEVSTTTGVRWLDVAGRTHAWADDSFHRDGDFVAYAVETLRNWKLPPDMIKTVSYNTRPLPFVRVEDTWACLTLRCARQKPFWLSSILHEKVKDFRRSGHTSEHRKPALDDEGWDEYGDQVDSGSSHKKKKNNKNKNTNITNNDIRDYDDDDSYIFFNDKDEARVRNGRRNALFGKNSRNGHMNTKGYFVSAHATMMELTDRIHIFLFKESHPSNESGNELSEAQANVWRSKVNTEQETNNNNNNNNNNKEDSEDQLSVRWRVVTVHRYRIPFIEDMLKSWTTRLLREETWVGIVRQLVHGITKSVQHMDYKYAERLDELEVILFNSSTKMSELSKILTQVHVIHRRANIYANLLRETQRCYIKLFKSLNVPINVREQKEILFLTNAVSLAEELHDQSRSLLALQFSVAAYTLEDHLRVLTIFTTFFIPLELITSWFGTNFIGMKPFMEDIWGMYFAVVLLVVTGAATNIWMRRTVIASH